MKTKKKRSLLIEQFAKRNNYTGDPSVVEKHIRDLEWYMTVKCMLAVVMACFFVSLLANLHLPILVRGEESVGVTALRNILFASSMASAFMMSVCFAQWMKVSKHDSDMEVAKISKKFIAGRKAYKRAFGRSLKNCRDYLHIRVERERAMCDLTEQAEGVVRGENMGEMRAFKAAHNEMFDAAKEMLAFGKVQYAKSYEDAKDLASGTMPGDELTRKQGGTQ